MRKSTSREGIKAKERKALTMNDSLPMVLGVTPFEIPNPYLVRSLFHAGALGILDLGRDERLRIKALQKLEDWRISRYGVRIPQGVTIDEKSLPDSAAVVVVEGNCEFRNFIDNRIVLVQVTSLKEAEIAQKGGAHGLIAKGAESGGRIGEKTAFILLQQLIQSVDLPIWVQGGIGIHSASACIAGGARGVVLDSQLALLRESVLNDDVKKVISVMNGTETTVVNGYRIFMRPDLRQYQVPDIPVEDIISHLGGSDPTAEYIPVGQDGSFAKRFADEYVCAQNLVKAIYQAAADNPRVARELMPLKPSSSICEALGIEYPIFQGPMSRITDTPGFALKIAEAGGLPFMALFVLSPEEIRLLLLETRSLLGNLPFGVGLLGFIPQEIFDAQVKVLAEIKPAAAIIGGGRPAQARVLESMGIKTFLHVPSNGLLELYLKEGVRNFIFEGRECGGHIGMLSSFILWEQQIGTLLKYEKCKELNIIFAGGIHDARSAAMAATMAAPLAARGCRIGVLLGTAYLFTEEAVASGALQPEYQNVALTCTETVEIESAPGHVTRVAANTEYPHFFALTKARLLKESPDRKTVWDALEELNIGRLRTAAKGGPKEGIMLSPTEQRREGSYMIGQLSALHDKTFTIRSLHQDVSEGGCKFLTSTRSIAGHAEVVSETTPGARPADIAIVGLACVFPDAEDIESFWLNIFTGKNSIIEVPDERWDKEEYFDPNEGRTTLAGLKTPSKWGGFIPETILDPLTFGIPPNSMPSIDPVQLLSLLIADRALRDAGYHNRQFDRTRVAVFFGAESGPELGGSYGLRTAFRSYFGSLPDELEAALPKLTEDSFPGVLPNIVAGRISNRLNLGGTNFVVDAACASSFAALYAAIKELTTGAADMVLCGGADLHNSINDYLLFSSAHALSSRDRCSPFDAEADGTILGEGIACVVLKRLADAERDGDRIYAVIKGIGTSSDGRCRGLTAPTQEGQELAMKRAYQQAGVKPSEVELLEAHGTGTVVGDTIELSSATAYFLQSGARPRTCVLGSIKSQIGHTKCAAGMAGLIKTALALQRRILPPTININKPADFYNSITSPFIFRDKPSPWISEKRFAGVSAFGFGGTNFHVVLSSYDEERPPVSLQKWPAEIFLFRGSDKKEALGKISRFESSLQRCARFRLRDLSKTVSSEKGGRVQVAIVAKDIDDLYVKLNKALQNTPDPEGVFFAEEITESKEPPKIAFLYPGQGSQKPGMLQELFSAFPSFHELLLTAVSTCGHEFYERLFPPQAFTKEDKERYENAVKDTRIAQPAMAVCDLTVTGLLQRLNIRPHMHAGHSFGEIVALCASGAIRESDVVSISKARAEFILQSIAGDTGAMGAVFASAEQTAALLGGEKGMEESGIVIANYNSPTQTIISGPTEAVSKAIVRITEAGVNGRTIPVACAFHSPIVKKAVDLFYKYLSGITINPPSEEVWSNLTAKPYPSDPEQIRRLLADQIGSPVRFIDQIREMYAAGAGIFVEAGPGNVLTNLVKEILGNSPHRVIARDPKKPWDINGFLCAVAELAVLGVQVDVSKLYEHRDAVVLDEQALRSVISLPKSAWIIDGRRARPISEAKKGTQLLFAKDKRPFRIEYASGSVTKEAQTAQATPSVQPVDGNAQAMLTYLRIMRELIAAQRDVMLGFLGHAPLQQAGVSAFSDQAQSAAIPLRQTTVNEPQTVLSTAEKLPPPQSEQPVSESFEKPSEHKAEGVKPAASIMETLVSIISERTGYPADMLNPSIDLEADLSIDSIKRIEILGELHQRLNMGEAEGSAESRQDAIEALVRLRTIGEIVEWIKNRYSSRSTASKAGKDKKTASVTVSTQETSLSTVNKVSRLAYQIKETLFPGRSGPDVKGKTYLIIDDGRGIAPLLADLLEKEGVKADIADQETAEGVGAFDGLIYLGALSGAADIDTPKKMFSLVKFAVSRGASFVMAAASLGGRFGTQMSLDGVAPVGGISGLLKTLAQEKPHIRVRVVYVNPCEQPQSIAEYLLYEFYRTDGSEIESGYEDKKRYVRILEPVPYKSEGGGKAAKLDGNSVLLLTGGARGITALAASAFAGRFPGIRIVLAGRTRRRKAEDLAPFAVCQDRKAIRKALIDRGERNPAIIESESARILKALEIEKTIADLTNLGAAAEYHELDVSDRRNFGILIDQLYERYGKIDGVIHGAGILEDKLIEDKTIESFTRVYDTKVKGALVLAEKLRNDVQFVVFFSSIAAVFGNRGQIDYAAANDALDHIAAWLNRRISGRAFSINWGPWRSLGMVSPELEREYVRRGVGLIEPEEGIKALLDEIFSDQSTNSQVILMSQTATSSDFQFFPARGVK